MIKQELPLNDIGGINTYVNPLSAGDGVVLHCVNLDSNPLGGKKKRQGYATFLGTADGAEVNTLTSWTQNSGSLFLYRASGSSLYHSINGTGAWTLSGEGTISNASHIGGAVLDNTFIVGDASGTNTTRHSTNGTSFTRIGAAPASNTFVEYQNRIYAGGTSSFIFYSTTGTASDWTSDSSSIAVPGAGKLQAIYKASDRIITNKTSGIMHRWDGDSMIDLATELGPSSRDSIANVEDFKFFLNRLGIFTSNGAKPQLISNAVQRQIYNDDGTGISGSQFDIASATIHRYDYFLSIGTVTDDLVGIQIPNAILKYNYQKNEFVNYKFADFPTAWHSYKDVNGVQQLIFGDSGGQVYKFGGVNSDNGKPIEVQLQMLFHGNIPFIDKEWGYLEVFTNPGCQAKIAIALENTFTAGSKKWIEIGSLQNGFNQFRFPSGSRGRLLFVYIYETSIDSPFELYGINFTFNPISR